MTKRFCDTEIWNKSWFQDLPIKQKLLTKFIFDNCDCAGILEISWRILKFYFDEEVTKDEFKKIKQVKFLDENTIFIEDFVLFQCSINSLNELNPNNNAHKGIIKRLEKYNLLPAPNQPLTSPSLGAHIGAQEKEKEKDKDKEKEKEKEKFDIYTSPEIEKVFLLYEQNCSNLCTLSMERRNSKTRQKVADFLFEIKNDFDYIKKLCIKANRLKFIVDKRIDFGSLINNHIGIMNGKYETNAPKDEEVKKTYPYSTYYDPPGLTEEERKESDETFKRLFLNRKRQEGSG